MSRLKIILHCPFFCRLRVREERRDQKLLRLYLHNRCNKTSPPSPFPHHPQIFQYKVSSTLLNSIYNCQYLLSRICHSLHHPNPPIEQFPPSIPKDSQKIQVYLSQLHLLHQQSKNNQQGEQLAPWKLTFNTRKCFYHCT